MMVLSSTQHLFAPAIDRLCQLFRFRRSVPKYCCGNSIYSDCGVVGRLKPHLGQRNLPREDIAQHIEPRTKISDSIIQFWREHVLRHSVRLCPTKISDRVENDPKILRASFLRGTLIQFCVVCCGKEFIGDPCETTKPPRPSVPNSLDFQTHRQCLNEQTLVVPAVSQSLGVLHLLDCVEGCKDSHRTCHQGFPFQVFKGTQTRSDRRSCEPSHQCGGAHEQEIKNTECLCHPRFLRCARTSPTITDCASARQ